MICSASPFSFEWRDLRVSRYRRRRLDQKSAPSRVWRRQLLPWQDNAEQWPEFAVLLVFTIKSP